MDIRHCLFAVLSVGLLLVVSCGAPRRSGRYLALDDVRTTISLADQEAYKPAEIALGLRKDTIHVVDFEGRQVYLMKTMKVDGEELASETLDAAVITARFRNLAERGGKVDLAFQIVVPERMLADEWQLRYSPMMYVLEDSTRLERVFVTGRKYRERQLRGYELYEKFLRRIITDSLDFIDMDRLEMFLSRNFKDFYRFKNDTSVVSAEDELSVEGMFGITETEAVRHFTDKGKIRTNDRLISQKDKMRSKYIKAPLDTVNLRLDTVVYANGNWVYNYVQTLDVRGRRMLKKVDVVLDGEVYDQGELLYTMPRTEPLTFYISSLSSFVDMTERYLMKVVGRKVGANAYYNISFPTGKDEVLPSFSGNAREISRIKSQLAALLDNKYFDLDSVVVVASASPEGTVAANGALARRRSASITRYFTAYMNRAIDSLNRDEGLTIDEEGRWMRKEKREPVRFTSRYVPEDWDGLSRLVTVDGNLTDAQKDDYFSLQMEGDADARERLMHGKDYYGYIRDSLYPALRSVKFEFNLHRKGMVQDTVVTTEIDTTYMHGVQALRDRDYEAAVAKLGPYLDYNSAVAYCALGRNRSALAILERDDIEKTAEVYYMLAVIYARLGDDEKAVQDYMNSCAMNPSYVHRGNLDPEIASLVRQYGLNRQDNYGTDL